MSWRPRNESKKDIARQNAAARAIEKELARLTGHNYTVENLSPFLYEIDWCFRREKEIMGVAEFKYREKSESGSGKYPEMMLGLAKHAALMHWGNQICCPAWMIYQFEVEPHLLYLIDCRRVPIARLEWGGNDRKQNGDKEPVVYLPLPNIDNGEPGHGCLDISDWLGEETT
ncbi:MAG: hypothetical protein AMS21_02060 [Gemmatimonas sp. SG8_38_2]|nr:MAG: hypothetical protein AMS21_02060 [Gemmatimonas sp. SG8_38_2]